MSWYDIFSDSYDQQLSDLNFKALRVYFCMRRGLQVNLNWVISWRCSQFNQKTNNQSQTLLAPRQREHYWGHLSSKSNAWVHCQCSEGGICHFEPKTKYVQKNAKTMHWMLLGYQSPWKSSSSLNLQSFEKEEEKWLFVKFLSKNMTFSFQDRKFGFCLNREKIGNHLRVNLKCCKSLQPSSVFHN